MWSGLQLTSPRTARDRIEPVGIDQRAREPERVWLRLLFPRPRLACLHPERSREQEEDFEIGAVLV